MGTNPSGLVVQVLILMGLAGVTKMPLPPPSAGRPTPAATLTRKAGSGKGRLVASIVCHGGERAAMMLASVD